MFDDTGPEFGITHYVADPLAPSHMIMGVQDRAPITNDLLKNFLNQGKG